jgi:16S rRNA A1518/A1519 N6-dimethyltransferase RsmA/KsgA/DIM1 with predicted DNA glycosylase/AP lyase activity
LKALPNATKEIPLVAILLSYLKKMIFANFMETLGEMTEVHKQLLIEHKKRVNTLSKETKSNFAVALSEAGILDTQSP